MKIGELAGLTRTQVETIRYYEREGLLPTPDRTGGNYRIYGESHVERLAFIRNCRNLDMTLDEIRVLLRFRELPDENCGEVNALLDEHIGHVAERVDGTAATGEAAQEPARHVPDHARLSALRHPEGTDGGHPAGNPWGRVAPPGTFAAPTNRTAPSARQRRQANSMVREWPDNRRARAAGYRRACFCM